MMEKKTYRPLYGLVLLSSFILTGFLYAQEPQAFDPAVHCNGVDLVDEVIAFTQRLDLPEDGILCYRNFTVAAGVSLSFNRNTLNTPVHILATEDIVIAGTVSVAGGGALFDVGGPGGFDGGHPGVDGVSEPGAGHGPGGGLGGNDDFPGGGRGGYGVRNPRPIDGEIYGSALLIPLVGGSGGGGGRGNPGPWGGGGGGAVLLAANGTITVSGLVNANGGGGSGDSGNSGSGGAIRLVAPKVAGTGTLTTFGGGTNSSGTLGRTRIDTFDSTEVALIARAISSLGSFVVAFPDPLPRLDILHVAGEDVPEGTVREVVVHLPPGSDPMQLVRVQTQNFPAPVEVEVVAVPDSGPASTASTTAAAGTDTIELLVEIPENTITHVFAWVR